MPPHNLEAEQAVLGSVLLDSESLFTVSEILHPEDFYERAHRFIYEAVLLLSEAGSAIDLVTVTEELRRQDKLDLVGGPAYIGSIAGAVPSSANAAYYANIVAQKSTLRALISASGEISAKCFDEEDDVENLLDEAEQKIFGIAQRRSREGFTPIKPILEETIESIERLSQHKGEVTGIPTFTDRKAGHGKNLLLSEYCSKRCRQIRKIGSHLQPGNVERTSSPEDAFQ